MNITKIDELINKFKEFKEELNKNVNTSYAAPPNAADTMKAEAGSNPKVMTVKKPLKPKDVEDAGPASFKVTVPKDNKGVMSERHPVDKAEGVQAKGINIEDVSLRGKNKKINIMSMVGKSEKIHTHKNGQWDLKNEGKEEHGAQINDNKGKTASGPV
jgi:hypothetical protein